MGTFVSVDIGGTQIRTALYGRESLKPLHIKKTATLAHTPDVYGRLEGAIASIWPKDEKVEAIALASPGPLDPHRGVIIATGNIPEWRNFPLTDKLSKRFDVPVFLDNDANLAGLGEWKFGAARGHHDVLYLTISTGIGGGVIIKDALLQGSHGLGTELGHTTIWPEGPMCPCGKRGHLESISSGPSIVRYVEEQIKEGVKSSLPKKHNLSARDVADAAAAGDALSIAAYERAGKYLGMAVANFLHIFNPTIVIFGGGVSQSGPLLFDPFNASLREWVLDPSYLEDLVITTAELGDDAGLLGALALAMISTNHH